MIDNPFRVSKLNDDGDFRPDWDVPELNAKVSDWLVDQVRGLRGKTKADPGQSIGLMIGPAGYGKTHLYGRIAHRLRGDVFLVFLPAMEPGKPTMDHVRWHLAEALFRPDRAGATFLGRALARSCRPAFADYFDQLPPTMLAKHATIARRLQAGDDGDDAVLEVVRKSTALASFLKLADSLVDRLPDNPSVVRALALGWAPAPWSTNARRWLRGDNLADDAREALGLGEDPPRADDLIRGVLSLLDRDRPMVLCFDQIESVLATGDDAAFLEFSSALMDLLHRFPAQIVLSCLGDTWDRYSPKFLGPIKSRIHHTAHSATAEPRPGFALQDLKPDQAVGLVGARMRGWPGAKAGGPATWPFEEASIRELIAEVGPTSRMLIQSCASKLEAWDEDGRVGTIRLYPPGRAAADPAPHFLRAWEHEVEAIRNDPARSAANLQDETLFRGILDLLDVAGRAGPGRTFAGVEIGPVEVKNVFKPSPKAKRLGARVDLDPRPGMPAIRAVVAVSKLESGQSLRHFYSAFRDAFADPACGAILIHPDPAPKFGAGTQAHFEEDQKSGKLRFLALEHHPALHAAMTCLSTFLQQARSNELIVGGRSISEDECRRLVLETRAIDGLELFGALSAWRRPEAKPAPAPTPTKAAPPPSVPNAAPAPKPSPAAPPQPPPAGGPDVEPWAVKQLAAAARKLGVMKLAVEPVDFQVGPTFVRLRVRPVGRTNFKSVSNKADDLRISLGLDATPLIGPDAGGISIDVQRPGRRAVPLAEALADPPKGLDGRPAFPVGLDVAGRAHWLNLADPSDCHLLVAGTTGSGKSEFLRAAIAGLASRLGPEQLRLILIDPKRVTFNLGGPGPYLRDPIARDLGGAMPLIEWCMAETDRRYAILEGRKLADVSALPPELLPRVVVVIDEFANFLAEKESKRAMTELLKRIGSMARAAGIHLILATQRPDKDVIVPILRENLPGRVALRVSSRAGSELIVGSGQAEHLLGKGDLLWKRGGELLRLQSPIATQAELESILRVGG